MSQRRCDRRACGFTLVELLVVIGIIAVLIGILLPALQSARRAANAVKCGTAMREIGNAFKMYEQENKGYAPPAQIFFDDASMYNLYGIDFHATADTATTTQARPLWYNFLAKYVTKAKVGGAGNASADASAQQLKSIFWACPSWDPYTNAAGPAGFNYTQPGLGMNGFPEYTSDFPLINQELGEGGANGDRVHTPRWDSTGFHANRWYKLNKWTKPSERALIGDCIFWFIEARPPFSNPFQQATVGQYSLANQATWSASASGQHQTTFDWYRHGKYPGLKAADEFKPSGGKIGYNVLFADGHVALQNDKESSYRVVRMRYPF